MSEFSFVVAAGKSLRGASKQYPGGSCIPIGAATYAGDDGFTLGTADAARLAGEAFGSIVNAGGLVRGPSSGAIQHAISGSGGNCYDRQ